MGEHVTGQTGRRYSGRGALQAGVGLALASTLGEERDNELQQRLTAINEMFMLAWMIQCFADSEAERFYTTGRSRRLPTEIRARAAMRLTQLNAATQIEDLKSPPSNRLETLKGDRKGQWSIRINEQWRVCFRFSNGDAFDVEIVDYH
jgi:proteic killer suppression protein